MAWRGVTPALVGTIVAMLPSFLTAALVVQIGDEAGLTLTGLGVIISLFFGMAALVSPRAGRLSERVGWANGLRISTLLSATALGAIALLGSSVVVIGISLAIAGAGSSLTQIASNLTIARCVVRRRHGWVLGIKHACVPAAMFLAGLAVPILALTVGWRWAFTVAAILALATTASVPRQEGPYTLTPPPIVRGTAAGKPTTPKHILVVLAVAVGLGIGALDPLGSFFVSYSVSIGVEEQVAGVLLSIGGLCGIVARLIAGRLIDRVAQADFTVIASMMAAGAVGLFIVNLGSYAGLLIGGLIGFTAGWGWSGIFTFAVVKDNPEAPAAAWGVAQTGKFLGAAIGPLLFGLVADRVSFDAAFWMSTIALLAAACLILYARNQRPTTGAGLAP